MAGRYDIKGKLARGGIGAIYLAHDNSLDREVAIKRLLPIEETKLNEPAGDSLSREASALAKFKHPNVVTIYSFEEDEEGAFVVTELIDGENLKETTERGALAIEDFENLVEQTLDPLITAKDMNLLHRDIKPSNIMVTILASGKFQIKILDFGLAKFSQTPSTQTLDQQGSFLGSIEYLAPEQLELRPLDQRTDLYSLGCVFYYTLTQVSPFEGSNAAKTMDNHLEHNVADIRSFRDDISNEMASWLMRLISRQPKDRPADARQAMKEYVDAKNGIMPPGHNLKSGPVETIVATEISEPVFPIRDADPIPMETGSQAIQLNTGPHALDRNTGPRGQTTGQRLLKQKQAEEEAARSKSGMKIPLIALASVIVLAGCLLALFSRDDTPPKEKNVVVTAPAKIVERSVTPSESSTIQPQAAGENKTTGAPPQKEIIALVAPPISDGLVAHYYAGAGVYSDDTQNEANIGQRVHLWKNIAPDSTPNHALTRLIKDKEGLMTPRLGSIGPDRFPGLQAVFPALEFGENTILHISPDKIPGVFQDGGAHVLMVGAFKYPNYLSIFRLLETGYRGGISISGYEDNLRGSGLSPDGEGALVSRPSKRGQIMVINYMADPKTGTHRLRLTTPDGKLAEVEGEIAKTAMKLVNYSIGGNTSNEARKGTITLSELLIYDGSLDDEDSYNVEKSLVTRYFGEKASYTTAPPPSIGAPQLATQRGLIAQFDAAYGLRGPDRKTEAASEGPVYEWENAIKLDGSPPFVLADKVDATQPIRTVGHTTPVNDPFPIVRFLPGTQMYVPNDNKISNLFPSNDFTLLTLIRMNSPEQGIITRLDGDKKWGMMMFLRIPEGVSLGFTPAKSNKKIWKKFSLKPSNWLFWRLGFDASEQRLKVHLSYPKGGWTEVISEKVDDLPTAISQFQIGARKSKDTKTTSFDLAQYALYNTFLQKQETDAVFQQWRDRYFKTE